MERNQRSGSTHCRGEPARRLLASLRAGAVLADPRGRRDSIRRMVFKRYRTGVRRQPDPSSASEAVSMTERQGRGAAPETIAAAALAETLIGVQSRTSD